MQDRMPPQNIDAETAVLGAMLIKKEAVAEARDYLKPEDFYQERNRLLFNAMLELNDRREAVDIVTVTEELKKKGNLEGVGGTLFVTTVANSVPTAANLTYHAKIVHEKGQLRRLIDASTAIANKAYEESEDVDEIMDEAQKAIMSVTSKDGSSNITPIRKILIDTIENIEKIYVNKGNLTGLSTGFRDLDKITSGLQKSDLVLVAARPSMGKTAFTLNIATHAAMHGHSTAFFSLEMSKEQLAQRMICSEGGIDSQRLKTGQIQEEEWGAVIAVSDKLSKTKLYIDDTPGVSIMDLRSRARRLKAEHDIELVIIDYLQLMQGRNNSRGDNRQQEISEISRSLKALARELNVPVVALSQLSRSVESRQIKKPMLSDLRESGSLEQDADIVMFLYREDYYDQDTANQNITDVIIAKNRNGPVETVQLYFQKEFTKFRDLTYVQE